MPYEDKTLKCATCGADFLFSKEEQDFFDKKGYRNLPKYCPECRKARREQRGRQSFQRRPIQRTSATVICSKCGKQTTVPFKPVSGRPVYCRDCYGMMKGR